MPGNAHGRWALVLSFTFVFGLVYLLNTADDSGRILPFEDVVFKTTGLRNNDKSSSEQVYVTSDSNLNGSLFEGEGVPMSLNSSSANEASVESNDMTRASLAPNESNKVADEAETDTSDETKQHMERWGGDLLNITELRRLVNQERENLIAQLKVDYGEDNYAKIFQVNGTSRGRKAFVSAHVEEGVSIQRFKRKLKMKILKMQTAIQAERESPKESSRRRRLDIDEYPDYYERFVWATGGHSASAGHGNLHNESYTAFMDAAVSDVFGVIGIEFEARNHAMGGTASAPEIALCSEAIFGTDADVISWDYGMTDANWFFRKAMYNQRAGLNPNRPAIIDLNVGGREFNFRNRINQAVEDRGLTSIYLDPDEFDDMEAMFPDTFGLSKQQVDALPPNVKHYKCQDTIEKGDPTCGEFKYTNLDICPERSGMASWHPGWKRMALWGNLLALFLSDTLLDLITELGAPAYNRSELLAQLQSEEDADYEKFKSSYAPDIIEYHLVPIEDDLVDDKNVSFLFRSPSICHTARLPAETRHLGILTESKQVGVHDYEYFKGISMKQAKTMTQGNASVSTMPLVYDQDDREQCDQAEIKRDYMDWFMVSSAMGPKTLTVPNDAERQAYGRESEKLQGILLLCVVGCPWGRCKDGELQLDAILNGTLQIDVNDRPVKNITEFRSDCGILRGEKGHRWQPNNAGQYVLKASVSAVQNSTFSFIRISSFIVL